MVISTVEGTSASSSDSKWCSNDDGTKYRITSRFKWSGTRMNSTRRMMQKIGEFVTLQNGWLGCELYVPSHIRHQEKTANYSRLALLLDPLNPNESSESDAVSDTESGEERPQETLFGSKNVKVFLFDAHNYYKIRISDRDAQIATYYRCKMAYGQENTYLQMSDMTIASITNCKDLCS